MVISSKEIIIIIIELILGGIITFILSKLNINPGSLKESILTILIAIITSSVVIYICYKKFKEVGEELDNQQIEHKKLDEKLKIYEQLIDMKVDIRELQKEVFKK